MEAALIAIREERARLATLRGLDIVSRELSEELQKLLSVTRRLLAADAVAIGLVEADVVHIKGKRLPGVPAIIPRPVAFATAVLEAGGPVVESAATDPRFASSVRGKAFLGCPLRAANGHCLGALIVACVSPRAFSPDEVEIVQDVAQVAEALVSHWVMTDELRPDGQAPGDARSLLDAIETSERLPLALGATSRFPIEIPLDIGRTSYDPELLRLVLRKHAPEILHHLLHHAPARFKDLLSAIPGLNQRTLTTRLAELRARDLVRRQAYDTNPPRVEYEIPGDASALVRQLLQVTSALGDATR